MSMATDGQFKLGCVAMMRDEASILPPFLDQATTFFDVVTMIDHASVDSSASLCAARDPERIRVLKLHASGYPQSEVTTLVARMLMAEEQLDALFLLDCDEFLPFADRPALERFLRQHLAKGAEGVLMPWVNICPVDLGGGNIFAGQFLRSHPSKRYGKVVLFSTLFKRCPGLQIMQGNHGVDTGSESPARISETPDTPILHIPVRSSAQFALKITNGYRVIMQDTAKRSQQLGMHWINLAVEYGTRADADAWLRRVALGYSDVIDDAEVAAGTLDFAFPYIKAPYNEASDDIAAVMLRTLHPASEASEGNGAFRILDARGEVLFHDKSFAIEPSSPESKAPPPAQILPECFAENYANLVEPLFSLPLKLQPSAWSGHIPFLFVLFRLLKPTIFVELGVHLGTSLTAAATAARGLAIPTRLYGVDTWQGDEHAGLYEGHAIYTELSEFVAQHFPAVSLLRCLFSEARPRFRPGSIDLLHIDGLHTYDAVKQDFLEWLPAMSENGVILFHDISVMERGFGVYRLWAELKQHYTTFEFHHSSGLGVLMLNGKLPALKPLLDLAAAPQGAAWYQSLVADVAQSLPERMGMGTASANADAQAQLQWLLSSTSWRVTAPLRAVRRMLR
jgi:hypothetical protein